ARGEKLPRGDAPNRNTAHAWGELDRLAIQIAEPEKLKREACARVPQLSAMRNECFSTEVCISLCTRAPGARFMQCLSRVARHALLLLHDVERRKVSRKVQSMLFDAAVSGGVVGIDGDVLVGKVAGPETVGAAAKSKIDVDGELGLAEVAVRGGFVEGSGTSAALADEEFAETDGDARWIDLGARVASGGDQPAPVGVVAGPGGLDQGRVRDSPCDAEGVGIGGGATDVELDQMGCAFCIGDDLLCQGGADVPKRGGERSGIALAESRAGCAAGEQQDGVVGGGVAIDGDAVEAGLCGAAEELLQERRVGGHVGE